MTIDKYIFMKGQKHFICIIILSFQYACHGTREDGIVLQSMNRTSLNSKCTLWPNNILISSNTIWLNGKSYKTLTLLFFSNILTCTYMVESFYNILGFPQNILMQI